VSGGPDAFFVERRLLGQSGATAASRAGKTRAAGATKTAWLGLRLRR
jgi:hypothetical protein